jgi:hypothetical protein
MIVVGACRDLIYVRPVPIAASLSKDAGVTRGKRATESQAVNVKC